MLKLSPFILCLLVGVYLRLCLALATVPWLLFPQSKRGGSVLCLRFQSLLFFPGFKPYFLSQSRGEGPGEREEQERRSELGCRLWASDLEG